MTTARKRYEARMYGIGYSAHATESAAKRALARFRREYREARHSLPYPQQTITVDGRTVYST